MDDIILIGYRISVNCEKMETILKELASANVDDTKGLMLYTLFQKKVMEDDFGAFENSNLIKQREESRNLMKKHWDQGNMNNGIYDNAAVVIVSGNKENVGTIINTNCDIKQILGYDKANLIGENISVMIPQIIGASHNLYMEKYFESKKSANTESKASKLMIAQHAKGYIVPCFIWIRLVPNVENGVQFFGFISQAFNLCGFRNSDEEVKPEDMFIFILDKNFEIVSFCENLASFCSNNDIRSTNIKRYLENKQKINLKHLYPNLFSTNNKKLMLHAEGLNSGIDLKPLKVAMNLEISDNYDKKASSDKSEVMSSSRRDNDVSVNFNLRYFELPYEQGKYSVLTMLLFNRQDVRFLKPSPETMTKNDHKTDVIRVEDTYENTSNTTHSIASQSSLERKVAKEIKNGIRDRSVTRGVRALQVVTVIVGIVLLIISCKHRNNCFSYSIQYNTPQSDGIERYVQLKHECL